MSYPVLLGGVVITASNKSIRFKEGLVTETVNLVEGTYCLTGDGGTDDLLEAVLTALATNTNAVNPNTYSATGSYVSVDPATASASITIAKATGSSTFQILWADAATTFDPALLGFAETNTADNTSAKTSTLSPTALWVSPDPHRELEPQTSKVVSVKRSLSGRVRGLERSSSMRSWRLGLGFVRDTRVLSVRNTSDPAATFEAFLDRYGAGSSMELHDVDTNGTTTALISFDAAEYVDTVCFSQETIERFEPRRIAPGTPLYAFDLLLHSRVTP